MSKVNWKGGALLAPLPVVMVSCGTMEKANVFTAAWTGIVSTVPPRAYISIRPSRYSYGIIRESGEFVINLTTRELCEACDYCGIVTGRCVDKVKKCGFALEPSEQVAAPRIAQSPLSLECRVFDVIPLGSHDMFLCDVLSVAVEETLIDRKGKLRLERAGLTAFAHGEYYALSDVIGKFGFSVADKKKGRGAVVPERGAQNLQGKSSLEDERPREDGKRSRKDEKRFQGDRRPEGEGKRPQGERSQRDERPRPRPGKGKKR